MGEVRVRRRHRRITAAETGATGSLLQEVAPVAAVLILLMGGITYSVLVSTRR